jgi:hypothetical protein
VLFQVCEGEGRDKAASMAAMANSMGELVGSCGMGAARTDATPRRKMDREVVDGNMGNGMGRLGSFVVVVESAGYAGLDVGRGRKSKRDEIVRERPCRCTHGQKRCKRGYLPISALKAFKASRYPTLTRHAAYSCA